MANHTQFFGEYIRPKIKRKVQQARYLLSDRSDLAAVTPGPRPLGYERIYHYHIRKTAGSSLNTAFKNAFRDPSAGMADEEALFARNWGSLLGKSMSITASICWSVVISSMATATAHSTSLPSHRTRSRSRFSGTPQPGSCRITEC